MHGLAFQTPVDSPGQETSATHRAYQALRRMILIGELPPGQKLKIEHLRGALDMGASPIREALSLLTSDHLVERLDQRGFRAAATSRENFTEILNLRCKLEEMALRESLANATDRWEERLVVAHHKMAREPRDNAEAFEARHRAFHMALLENCTSPILMKFCGQLYDLNIRYRYLAGQALNYQKRDIAAEHAAILDAAIERDVDRAADRLLSHYRQTGAFLTDLLSEAAT